ncbi:hypothetical protein V2J52_16395 [Georgenia sp. MJ173]|uniref:hypothetical protein n=1 Tax=Georgenia sunbinii TaxID=3117728 RepID=UPI002F26757B
MTNGAKSRLVTELGASYHSTAADDVMAQLAPDIIIEATGTSPVVLAAMAGAASYGILS